MSIPLPVIKNCDNCGACCLEQGSPPGYLYLLRLREGGEDLGGWPDADDLRRFERMPPEAKEILLEYRQWLLSQPPQEGPDPPCCWLDHQTKRCRFYDHRPQICRDLEVGSEDCRGWREAYHINLATPRQEDQP